MIVNGADDHDESDDSDDSDEGLLEVVFLDYAEAPRQAAAKRERPSRQQVNKSKHLLASNCLNCTSTNNDYFGKLKQKAQREGLKEYALKTNLSAAIKT